MLDHPGPFSEAHGGPKMAQNITKMAKNFTKMALYDPKCPYMTPNSPKTLPLGILHDIVSCWTILGPRWPLKRPQGGPIWNIIMYYAPEKCLRAILGHAGTFLVMKGYFGS